VDDKATASSCRARARRHRRTAADLTILRTDLRRQVIRALPPRISAEDIDRLLLNFEELASNGLRHGRRQIRVTVSQDDTGWLIDVSDAAPEVRRPLRSAATPPKAVSGFTSSPG
jgi:signal transduction histidine kinase